MFGSFLRLSFDLLLVSGFLAGLKRSTGLTPAVARIGNKDVRQVIGWYLELGEYAMDFAQVFLGRSGYFTREIK